MINIQTLESLASFIASLQMQASDPVDYLDEGKRRRKQYILSSALYKARGELLNGVDQLKEEGFQ